LATHNNAYVETVLWLRDISNRRGGSVSVNSSTSIIWSFLGRIDAEASIVLRLF